jgi:TnpA family transposase
MVIPVRSHSYTRLGFALSLCALRFLGFIPEELSLVPENAMLFVLKQINLESIPVDFEQYGIRAQTRTDHALRIEQYLSFKPFNESEQESLKAWLLIQAMEHDRPILLLRMAIDKLKQDQISRPTLVFLERLVSSVREMAKKKTYQLMADVLSDERKRLLDNLLISDKSKGKTLLTWLKQRAVSSSPEAICTTLEKIVYLESAGVNKCDLTRLSTNRLKLLSRLGQTSTNQALQRSVPEKRYPVLVAFMFQALEELIDEAIELFDQSITQAYSRAKNSLKSHQEKVQESINEKVRILKIIGAIILDENIADPELRKELYGKIPLDKLRLAIDDCGKLMRPENDKGLDYFANRFSYLRQYTPTFLQQIQFKSAQADEPVIKAIEIIKEMNQSATRKVPANAPTDFVNSSWQQYVFNNDKIERQYYELCTLWELRNCLRSGDVWVDGGRRYNNPEHYLIPKSIWPEMKADACNLLQISDGGTKLLNDRQAELKSLFTQLDSQIINDTNIKIVDKQLVITPLDGADEPESLKELRQLISERLPKVGLTDIVMEVDSWLGISECFYHAGNQTTNKEEFPTYLYAALLSEATNLGPVAMADASELDYERIIWYKNWYIRDDTIQAARTKLVNFQHEQILAQHFGDGTFSSSDGRRVPVAVKTRTAKAFVKYFAYETGLNFYSWTSDQFSQYGCKITSPTMREATLVLDAILDNETELNIERHTTDTAGYTEIIFALFDLLGLQFDPRIRNLGDQRIYYIGDKPKLVNINRSLS